MRLHPWPVLALRPHTASFGGQFTLKKKKVFTVSSVGLPGQTPLRQTSSASPHTQAFKGLPPAAF